MLSQYWHGRQYGCFDNKNSMNGDEPKIESKVVMWDPYWESEIDSVKRP